MRDFFLINAKKQLFNILPTWKNYSDDFVVNWHEWYTNQIQYLTKKKLPTQLFTLKLKL